MKKKLLLLGLLAAAFFSNAQNVGIGTANPQSTLDVKGNIRTGGNSNFIQFDSLSGKITWTNSNLFVTGPQYLMKHSASAEGLFSNGAQLEYRNQLGNPIFFTNWSSGTGYFSGNVGIGTITPGAKVEITHHGSSDYGTALLVNQDVIGNSDGPKIQFRKTMTSTKSWTAGILNGVNIDAFAISEDGGTNGFGTPRLIVAPGGYIGINTTAPAYPLDIFGRMRISGTNVSDPGIWLNDYGGTGIDGAFIGLQDYNHVGFYGGNGGTGWGLTMNTMTGAVAINGNTGTTGQALTSNGTAAPSWNNTPQYFFFSQTGSSINLTGALAIIPGINGQTFTTTFTSNLIVTVTSSLTAGSGQPSQGLQIIANVQVGPQIFNFMYVQPQPTIFGGGNATSTVYISNVPAGTYTILCKGQQTIGSGTNSCSQTQLIVQAIPM